MQIVLWCLVALPVVLAVCVLWEVLAAARTLKRFPPPGVMVDVGGRRLHLHCIGEGSGPTVVIESGRFNTSPMWAQVQSAVGAFSRVCTYDRAGYAWSDPDSEARTGDRVAADLHRLLRGAEIPGPYVLVGHSLGSIYVRYFAQQYPDEVAGVVLVDPYTEGEVKRQPRQLKALQVRSNRTARLLSRAGIPRLAAPFLKGVTSELKGFSSDLRIRITALTVSWQLWKAVDREWSQMARLVDHLGGPGSMGDKPLVILSAGRCDLKPGGWLTPAGVDDLWRLMKESQAELTQLSSKGRLVMVPDAGHGIAVERPEAVVAAIRGMLGSPA